MLVNLTMMTLGMWSLSLHEALALIFRWNCLYRYHYCCCCYCYFYYCCEALAMAGVLKMKKIINIVIQIILLMYLQVLLLTLPV